MAKEIEYQIDPGTIRKTTSVVTTYEPEKKPTLQLRVKKGYEVSANGTVNAEDVFGVDACGTQVKHLNMRPTRLGLFDAVRAIWRAWKNRYCTGGITQEDVDEVKKIVDEYNDAVKNYNQIIGKTEVEKKTNVLRLEDIANAD